MKRADTKTWTFLVALAVALWLLAPPTARADEADPSEPDVEAESDAEATGKKRPRRPTGTRSTWWNDPRLVEALGLGEEQREKMDGIYKKYLEERPSPTERGNRREPFAEALVAGDMKTAQKKLDELVQETSAPVRAHGELKIQVLSLLTTEQQAKLAADHENVIKRSWIPGTRRAGAGPRGAQGQRRRAAGGRKAAP
ncbi:MAG: Spy/CpxP family protein refolding chaperone [Myxococcota bacterium]